MVVMDENRRHQGEKTGGGRVCVCSLLCIAVGLRRYVLTSLQMSGRSRSGFYPDQVDVACTRRAAGQGKVMWGVLVYVHSRGRKTGRVGGGG